VEQGQQIGTTGSTGNSSGPHIQGDTVTAEGDTNNWWSKLRDQGGFISNIYIDHPDPQLPGVPTC
jgi:hypothetical protein